MKSNADVEAEDAEAHESGTDDEELGKNPQKA